MKKVQKMFGSLENYALSLHPQNERNTVLRYTRKMMRPETMACGIDRKKLKTRNVEKILQKFLKIFGS